MAEYISKAKRRANFTTVNNDYLQDDKLSWKAKGLITYIMSLPENWQLNVSDLKNRSKDGRDSTANGIKELIENGYCKRVTKRQSGSFDGYEYFVSDCQDFKPITENPFPVNPKTDNSKTEKPFSENTEQINTNNTNKTFIENTNNSFEGSQKIAPLFENEIPTETDDNKRKTLFRNSDVFKLVDFSKDPADFSKFFEKFKEPEFQKIDLIYYFHSVSDWSDQRDMKRTARGWIATVRTFIRGDVEKNKLKLKAEFKPETQKINVSGAMEYLTEDY